MITKALLMKPIGEVLQEGNENETQRIIKPNCGSNWLIGKDVTNWLIGLISYRVDGKNLFPQ